LIALLDYSNYHSQSIQWFDCAIYWSCRTLLILKLDASDRAYVKVQSQVHIHYNLHVVHWWSRHKQECCDLQKLTRQVVRAVIKLTSINLSYRGLHSDVSLVCCEVSRALTRRNLARALIRRGLATLARLRTETTFYHNSCLAYIIKNQKSEAKKLLRGIISISHWLFWILEFSKLRVHSLQILHCNQSIRWRSLIIISQIFNFFHLIYNMRLYKDVYIWRVAESISARFQSSMSLSLVFIQKNRIAMHLQQRLSSKIIVDVEEITDRTVRKIRDRLKTYDQHSSSKMSAMRQMLLIYSAVRIDLRHFLEDQPWSYQNEMLYYLFDDWDIIVALFTLFNALKIMKINRKCLKREALKRSQKCRNLYFLDVSQFTHEMLVFLNESAVNEHTMHRKRDWTLYDISSRIIWPVKRSERWSILLIYCSDDILIRHIHQRNISEAHFEWFLTNEILSRCSRFSESKSMLILDNASVHHTQMSDVNVKLSSANYQ